MSKLKFTETDHKHWESNKKDSDTGNPLFTIDTAYRNKYLQPENRAKTPIYLLAVWNEGKLIFAQSFRSLKDSINFAKTIKP